jgi:site-specific recombinase XerD
MKNRGRWRVRWRATNRQATHNRIFSGSKVFTEKADAVACYAEMEKQERLWRKGQIPGRTIEQVLQDYFRYAQQFTKRTQGHYRMVLKVFADSLPEDVIWIQQIRPCHIRGYLSRLLDHGNKNRTCNAHLTVIKSFCRYLHETYDVPNPTDKVRMLKEEPADARCLTKEEYEKVLAIAPPVAKNRLMFLANTGLRASEFASLKPDSVNDDLTALTIIGKGRKRRTIPLNELARKLWPEIEPASRKALWFQFRGLARKAKVPPFGPHALRHYFATQLLLAGVPIIKVSMVLGHSSVKTTQACYAHILPADLKHITDVLEDEPDDPDSERTKQVRFPRVHHQVEYRQGA